MWCVNSSVEGVLCCVVLCCVVLCCVVLLAVVMVYLESRGFVGHESLGYVRIRLIDDREVRVAHQGDP